ncbi:energy-coupling factor transporter ATP-binding protein EcfA2 [Paenibacillus sp. V4I7]|nr:energy-coupling factor transporter ATP-binding protein EcfA2 [Paenibacillus sp. V4I7]
MTLPTELSSIFSNKQKSYKMVLILALLTEMQATGLKVVSLLNLKQRFLSLLQERESNGLIVDQPPEKAGTSWGSMTVINVQSVITTPISALSSILEQNNESIGFKKQLYDSWSDDVLRELYTLAQTELENYYNELNSVSFSIKDALSDILSTYITAKKETFAGHRLGNLIRQQIPARLRKLPFIHSELKITGSVGQGNWATIPWIAIMDKRITETTRQGEYLVYLFSEDMKSVYLTFMQGVTIPIETKGKQAAYQYFKQKVQGIRHLLPLEGMVKDAAIYLTSGGLGQDYQVSTVAYYRYDSEHLPYDEQLIADLNNAVTNYNEYVNKVLNQNDEPEQMISFNYTISHLYAGQGILKYLYDHRPNAISLDQLISNQGTVLLSGDDVKHPKERVRHLGRALQDLGLLSINENQFSLTDLGQEYANHFNENKWTLSDTQVRLIRDQLNNAEGQTPLVRSINKAIEICKELGSFTLDQFAPMFINALGMLQTWGEVTQKQRSIFMLNWLEILKFVIKSGQQYTYIEWEETPLVDALTVIERIATIKNFIASKGFMYPDHWIENFFLSLKAKPFVILAGVSGTGKTKLMKLFAEAVGATASNGQFSLIPVRPDWSDPSDLLGYKDLSGVFRPGKLTEVLVEASKPSNQHKPYFICLDEMNLARVEHYFSDLLSVLETQEWDNHRIVTTPLIHRDSLQNESDKQVYGNLHLPDNVYIVGTVNMDETTHPFSKKVLDRANTIEFNYIDLGQYPTGEGMPASEGAAVPPNSLLRSEYLQLVDVYRDYKQLTEETTELLVEINGILEQIHSHVGFRIRDAVCFYMIYNDRFALLSKEAAFDMQLLQKILPRIQGSNSSVKKALLQLMQVAQDRSLPITEYMEDASKLYLSPETLAASKYPQSARKIAFMLRRLEEDGFTSYWLS